MRPVIDLHQDLRLYVERRDLYPKEVAGTMPQTGFAELQSANVRVTFVTGFAVPPSGNFFDPVGMDMMEEDFKWYREYVATHPKWRIVTTLADVRACRRGEGHGLLLHIEGFNAFTGSDADWERLEEWNKLGLRSIGPAWNRTNPSTGGTEETEAGLTSVGRKLAEWIEASHMIFDAAHMSRPAFFELAGMTRRPIFVSHGNTDVVCPSLRNYTDEQLQAIAKSDGVIGVFCSGKYVAPPGVSLHRDTLIAHMEHIKKTIGVRHLALGTDFGGITTGLPEELSSIVQVPQLFIELEKRGWSSDDIDAVAFGNAERVIAAHLGE